MRTPSKRSAKIEAGDFDDAEQLINRGGATESESGSPGRTARFLAEWCHDPTDAIGRIGYTISIRRVLPGDPPRRAG